MTLAAYVNTRTPICTEFVDNVIIKKFVKISWKPCALVCFIFQDFTAGCFLCWIIVQSNQGIVLYATQVMKHGAIHEVEIVEKLAKNSRNYRFVKKNVLYYIPFIVIQLVSSDAINVMNNILENTNVNIPLSVGNGRLPPKVVWY